MGNKKNIVLVILFSVMLSMFVPIETYASSNSITFDFDSGTINGSETSSVRQEIDGVTLVIEANRVSDVLIVAPEDWFDSMNNSSGDMILLHDGGWGPPHFSVNVRLLDNSPFNLTQFTYKGLNASDETITINPGGGNLEEHHVIGDMVNIYNNGHIIAPHNSANFQNITSFTITGTGTNQYLIFDNFVIDFTSNTEPTVTTGSLSSVTSTSATVSGNVTFDGGDTITERGIEYRVNGSGEPYTAVTASTVGTGEYSVDLTGLAPNTTYDVRAYATNSQGTSYGSVNSFTTLSNNADLSALSLSSGTLDTVFDSGTTEYTASVGNEVSSITVTPTVADATATVTVNGAAVVSGAASGAINLAVGANTITVVVTAQDGSTKPYTVVVTRGASSNADLSNLTLSEGTLSPVFDSGTTEYTASVGNEVSSMTVTPTVADATATVTVNGAAVVSGAASGAINLAVGENTITVVVTAQDGSTKPYTVVVTRGASSNADLSNLTLSEGTLSPVFASGTTDYTTSVANAVTSITVTPTVADATATVTVNGAEVVSGAASGAINLAVGENTITVVVTAQDGSTKSYTVVVTRGASNNADLSNLTLSEGTLSPVFASGTTDYTASVANAVTSITVTPTVVDATAMVTVNGAAVVSGAASGAINLDVGANTITVVITAQDASMKTYTLVVTREAAALSDNANLSGLSLSSGTLNPVFVSETTDYTASVANAVTSITVTPTVTDPSATVTVNGTPVVSGGASGAIGLNLGANTITVVVTAEDGTTIKTYTVTVTRAENLTYTVAYEGNGSTDGSVPLDSKAYEEGESITVLGNTGNLERTGYIFTGWNTQADGHGTNYSAGATFTMGTKNVTLYANWIDSTSIRMTANPDNVKGNTNFNQIFILNLYNDTVTGSVYADDINLGNIFSTLNISSVSNSNNKITLEVYGSLNTQGIGTIALNQSKLNNSTTPLIAEVLVTLNTVTYYGNGNTGGSVPTDSNRYAEGSSVTVLENTGNLVRSGYTFVGWNTQVDGSGIDYIPGSQVIMGISNVTLYAKWEAVQVPRYTVTYHGNGNTGGSVPTDSNAYEEGASVTVRGNTGNLVKTGYTFAGWNTQANGQGSSYTQGSTLIMATTNINLYAKWTKTSSGGGSSGGGNADNTIPALTPGPATEIEVEAIVDGEKIVELRTDSSVLSQKIDEIIALNQAEGKQGPKVLEISVAAQGANQIRSILTGDIVKKMEDNQFTLVINTEKVDYVIPAKEIAIEKVAAMLNVDVTSLQQIEIEVRINYSSEIKVNEIVQRGRDQGMEVITQPVEFQIVARTISTAGEVQETIVSQFTSYVSRVMEIPQDVDPSKITTGIIYNADGTFSHIPTTVYMENGKWYAKLNSLTNSSYLVVWNPITVASVENHWSKAAVNDMASRLVIKNPETFNPEGYITRGEFAKYITKALGIYRTGVAKVSKFTDVEVTNKLADAIETATEYGIIKGYPDGSFRPDAKISREEAMVMYSKAMDIVGLKEIDNSRIENYKDKEEIAAWAYEFVKKTVSIGVFSGRTGETINPKDTFTYAEAATAIRSLLVRAGLIND
ncbi:cell wall/surface repeat protein [Clostridium aceticum]|uniref:Cell wall/surface repeat protein n=1 Tax=Clostridium aceticum TaxID=84022 RepID=A0A0G3WCI2_9CLOT|nr:cadherin-like beta sandwich domain-containing protein [Clostridium aceticum]AKL96033.1 cell wall/surface repeat protein [Clostridium aceticum]